MRVGLEAMPAEAEAGWWHIFGFLNVEQLREEVALAKSRRRPEPDAGHRTPPDGALVEAFDKVRSGEPDGVGHWIDA